MTENYRYIIKEAVFDEASFIKLVCKGKRKGQPPPLWQAITVRPVLLTEGRHLQFTYFDGHQTLTKNYQGDEALAPLDEALAMPFNSLSLHATGETLAVQITKKGKAILHRHQTEERPPPDLAHDREKESPIPANQPNPVLHALGIMRQDGTIKAGMQGKFAQINKFLELLEHTDELDNFERSPLNILDCGCGHAYLTLATHYYLNEIRGLPARIIGIDVNERLMEKCTGIAAGLPGCEARFWASSIIEFAPEEKPDIIFALHACDTATDEALAQAIRWGTRLILSVPCCHHDLNPEIEAPLFRPVLRHGILRERLADLLTDSFRALILRIMGYRTDVIEFISTEHTARNLMIRAVKSVGPGERQFVEEYEALKTYWGVTPHLEKLLGEEFYKNL